MGLFPAAGTPQGRPIYIPYRQFSGNTPDRDPMESALELKQLDSDLFVNVHPAWLPDGAQGIYGGTLIAHTIMAAGMTVSPDFKPHSLHCYFLQRGAPDVPLVYHVKRALRTESDQLQLRRVVVRQRGGQIFIATMCFSKCVVSLAGNDNALDSRASSPNLRECRGGTTEVMSGGYSAECPFLCTRITVHDADDSISRTTQWVKAKRDTDANWTHLQHAAALAYLSDNFFFNTLSRLHNVIDPKDPEEKMCRSRNSRPRDTAAMMVSLDHSIYFHSLSVSSDIYDWFLAEAEAPWAGCGRGIVLQRLYSERGELLATATQEVYSPFSFLSSPSTDTYEQGLIRLAPPEHKM